MSSARLIQNLTAFLINWVLLISLRLILGPFTSTCFCANIMYQMVDKGQILKTHFLESYIAMKISGCWGTTCSVSWPLNGSYLMERSSKSVISRAVSGPTSSSQLRCISLRPMAKSIAERHLWRKGQQPGPGIPQGASTQIYQLGPVFT